MYISSNLVDVFPASHVRFFSGKGGGGESSSMLTLRSQVLELCGSDRAIFQNFMFFFMTQSKHLYVCGRMRPCI